MLKFAQKSTITTVAFIAAVLSISAFTAVDAHATGSHYGGHDKNDLHKAYIEDKKSSKHDDESKKYSHAPVHAYVKTAYKEYKNKHEDKTPKTQTKHENPCKPTPAPTKPQEKPTTPTTPATPVVTPTTPGKGQVIPAAVVTTPAAPAPVTPVAKAAPVELPTTGAEDRNPMTQFVSVVLAGLIAYGATYFLQHRFASRNR